MSGIANNSNYYLDFKRNITEKDTNSKKDNSVTLNLSTQNTGLLPDFIFAGNSAETNLERVSRLPSTLSNYDFVGLQETFSDISLLMDKPQADLNKIKTYVMDNHLDFSEMIKLKNIGENGKKSDIFPYKHREDNGNLILQDSGLTVFSKNKILETDFQKFSWSTGSDSMSRKGVLFSRVDIPGIGKVDIYNTHLQANYGDSELYPLIQMTQIDQISNFIKKHDQGYPTFIMGDFNMVEGSKEHTYMMEKIGANDSFRSFTDEPGYTFVPGENPNISEKGAAQRLDYILFKNGKDTEIQVINSEIINNQPVDNKFVSDHYGLHTEFKITRKE